MQFHYSLGHHSLAGGRTLAPILLAACASVPQSQDSLNLPTFPDQKAQVLAQIEEHYFTTPQPDTSLSIPEMVGSLDPFSCYMTAEYYERWQHHLQDEDIRFGFNYDTAHHAITVTSVLNGSAAEEAGILPGDEIETVSRQPLYGSEPRLWQLLKQGTETIDFGIRRANQRKPIRIWMHRAACPDPCVPLALMLDSSTGYVEFTGFNEDASEKLRDAIAKLQLHGARSLIIDLRSNPGGYMQEALKAVNLFVHSDTPVLHEHSRVTWENRKFALPGQPSFPNMPLVLLVGAQSASASEIFAGILQDLGRVQIVGQPTCGKAMVMRIFDAPKGDKLYLAISEYYLPSGRCIQRTYNGPKLSRDYRALETAENFDHKIDSQLAETDCEGYAAANGQTLYATEGIVPDVIVSETDYPNWLREAILSAEVPFLHQNAEDLLSMRLDGFDRNWTAPEQAVEQALEYSRCHDTSSQKEITARAAWEIPLFLKWYLAYHIWGDKGTFAIRTRHSSVIRRAQDILLRMKMNGPVALK